MPLRPPLEKKHRLLLVLIAAFADAAVRRRRSLSWSGGLGWTVIGTRPGKIDARLGKLVEAGVLEVGWHAGPKSRNLYRLRLGGGR